MAQGFTESATPKTFRSSLGKQVTAPSDSSLSQETTDLSFNSTWIPCLRRIPPTTFSERLRDRETAGKRRFLIRAKGAILKASFQSQVPEVVPLPTHPRASNPQSRPLISPPNLKIVHSSSREILATTRRPATCPGRRWARPSAAREPPRRNHSYERSVK